MNIGHQGKAYIYAITQLEIYKYVVQYKLTTRKPFFCDKYPVTHNTLLSKAIRILNRKT